MGGSTRRQLYNVVWGAAVIAFPVPLSRLAGLEVATVIPLVQVIGMLVGVYAIGYYLLAREPLRYAGLIWIALAGKTLWTGRAPVLRDRRQTALEVRLDLRAQ